MNKLLDDIEMQTIWDKPSALNRLMGDEALLDLLIQKFNRIVVTELSELITAINEQDTKSIQMRSHKLKGSASAIGALRIAIVAKAIEQGDVLLPNEDLITRLSSEIELFLSTVNA